MGRGVPAAGSSLPSFIFLFFASPGNDGRWWRKSCSQSIRTQPPKRAICIQHAGYPLEKCEWQDTKSEMPYPCRVNIHEMHLMFGIFAKKTSRKWALSSKMRRAAVWSPRSYGVWWTKSCTILGKVHLCCCTKVKGMRKTVFCVEIWLWQGQCWTLSSVLG